MAKQVIIGTDADENLSLTSGWGRISAGSGDDTLSATAMNGAHGSGGEEVHTYAGAGNDITYLNFGNITDFSAGHHARGGSNDGMSFSEQQNIPSDDHTIPSNADLGSNVVSEGADVFVLNNLQNVGSLIVGRFEDIDHSRDEVYIGSISSGSRINFSSGSGTIAGHSWRIVEWNGDHIDSAADSQQWLMIDTSGGGTLLYAIEGARVDNSPNTPGGVQESHFVSETSATQFVASNPTAVEFVDPVNIAPSGYVPDLGGLLYDDYDSDQSNVDSQIVGTNVGDVIAAGLNDDNIAANAGADTVWGGSGADQINGGSGDDSLFGGSGLDTLIGADGNDFIFGGGGSSDIRDLIYGGNGNDTLDGGHGNDEVRGDSGNDHIDGGYGSDTLIGGSGNDTVSGEALGDMLYGGSGDDFLNGGYGFDRLNGGAGADKFYHLGILNHGSDWVQDYNSTEGDVLLFGGSATRDQFQVNFAETANAGTAGVEEAFVIYRPTGQTLWALIDGGGQSEINLSLGGVTYDLLP